MLNFQTPSKIDSVKVIILNSQGKAISWGEIPVDTGVDTAVFVPSKIDNTTMISAIRNHVPLSGMALSTLDVIKDSDGALIIMVGLSVRDIETANNALPEFMQTLFMVIEQLRIQQGAVVASCKVDLIDADGQPLLRYVKDFQPSQELENWWQAPGLTQDWFPHPLPSAGSTSP